jgi:hypothetical protein
MNVRNLFAVAALAVGLAAISHQEGCIEGPIQ